MKNVPFMPIARQFKSAPAHPVMDMDTVFLKAAARLVPECEIWKSAGVEYFVTSEGWRQQMSREQAEMWKLNFAQDIETKLLPALADRYNIGYLPFYVLVNMVKMTAHLQNPVEALQSFGNGLGALNKVALARITNTPTKAARAHLPLLAYAYSPVIVGVHDKPDFNFDWPWLDHFAGPAIAVDPLPKANIVKDEVPAKEKDNLSTGPSVFSRSERFGNLRDALVYEGYQEIILDMPSGRVRGSWTRGKYPETMRVAITQDTLLFELLPAEGEGKFSSRGLYQLLWEMVDEPNTPRHLIPHPQHLGLHATDELQKTIIIPRALINPHTGYFWPDL